MWGTSRTVCRSGNNAAVRSTFGSIKKITYALQEEGEHKSQKKIQNTSKETYALQERGERSSQIEIMQTSKEVTYGHKIVNASFLAHWTTHFA